MTEEQSPVWVLYGSQTGTAREAALDVSRTLRVRSIDVRVSSLNDVWREHFQSILYTAPPGASHQGEASHRRHQYVICVVSTTGQGEPPDNMKQFWKEILKHSVPVNAMSHWKFSIFGLGDSRYPQFNYTARKLRTRLKQLGAEEFFRIGLGDEQHDFGYEGEFDPWKDQLLLQLLEEKGLTANESVLGISTSSPLLSPDFIVEVLPAVERQQKEESVGSDPYREFRCYLPDRPLCPHPAPIMSRVQAVERLTASDHFQDVQHLQISLPSTTNLYPGDCVSIYPHIPSTVVLPFLQDTLRLDPMTQCRVLLPDESMATSSPFPQDAEGNPYPLTLYEIFTYYYDITAIPGRHLFNVLSYFTDNDQHREKLLELGGSTLESKDAYYEYCKSERRTIAEVLWDFHSCRSIPLDHLLSIIPIIVPRKYTAASARWWYSRRLWWTFGCLTLMESPLLWGQSAPWIMLWTYQNEGRTNETLCAFVHRLCKGIGSCHHPPCDSLTLVKRRLERWRHQEAECRWKRVFEKRKEKAEGHATETKTEDRRSTPSDASSSSDFNVDLCIAVTKYKTKLQREKFGLCSSHLASCHVGDVLPVVVDVGLGLGSDWQPPFNAPLLLISPGTGLTPCRSLIQERYLHYQFQRLCEKPGNRCGRDPHQKGEEETMVNDAFGPTTVVLGFRHPDKDFLYETDWNYFVEHAVDGVRTKEKRSDQPSMLRGWIRSLWRRLRITGEVSGQVQRPWSLNLMTAFSRYWPDRTVYVQDVLEEHPELVASILTVDPSSVVLVSGRSTPMPSQVLRACQDILTEQIPLSLNRAVQYLETMRKTRRLIFDTWG